MLASKLEPGATVSAYDVARLMAELKAARLDKNGHHEDSVLDQINYLVTLISWSLILRHSLVVSMSYCKVDTNGPHCLSCQGSSLPDTLLRVTVPPYLKLQLRALAFSALFLPWS